MLGIKTDSGTTRPTHIQPFEIQKGSSLKKSGRRRLTNFLFSGLTPFTFTFIFLFPFSSSAQTPTTQVLTTQKTHILLNAKYYFLGDYFIENLYPALKAELNLTDDQVLKTKEIKTLLMKYTAREAHNFQASLPWDPKDEKAFRKNISLKILELEKSLGEEKFDDLCQYIVEEDILRNKINRLVIANTDLSDIESRSNELFNEITDSVSYKEYKNWKLNSNRAAFLQKHEQGLRLRILFELNDDSVPSKQPISQRPKVKRDRRKKSNEILKELSALY